MIDHAARPGVRVDTTKNLVFVGGVERAKNVEGHTAGRMAVEVDFRHEPGNGHAEVGVDNEQVGFVFVFARFEDFADNVRNVIVN